MKVETAVYTLLFYAFAAASVLFALLTVLSRRLLRAAVWLMFVLLFTAGLYVMLGVPFLAGIQVLVYIGGIVVLIAFAVMLTSSNELLQDKPTVKRKVLGFVGAVVFVAITVPVVLSANFRVVANPSSVDVALIGKKLLDYGATGFVLPFELISLLLLAAVIGGIVVARKK